MGDILGALLIVTTAVLSAACLYYFKDANGEGSDDEE